MVSNETFEFDSISIPVEAVGCADVGKTQVKPKRVAGSSVGLNGKVCVAAGRVAKLGKLYVDFFVVVEVSEKACDDILIERLCVGTYSELVVTISERLLRNNLRRIPNALVLADFQMQISVRVNPNAI